MSAADRPAARIAIDVVDALPRPRVARSSTMASHPMRCAEPCGLGNRDGVPRAHDDQPPPLEVRRRNRHRAAQRAGEARRAAPQHRALQTGCGIGEKRKVAGGLGIAHRHARIGR